MNRGPDRRAVLAGLAAMAALPAAAAPRRLAFEDLPGWAAADHDAALRVFRASLAKARAAGPVRSEDWAEIAAALASGGGAPARAAFESLFVPVAFSPDALFTAYYEPEIAGARAPDSRHRHPIRRKPADPALLAFSRAEIAAGGLDGRGLELLWLADPVEAFFLHVQGSGRIRLPDGGLVRVGFAGRNAHPYRSIGQALARRGLKAEAASAGGIRRWLRANPQRAQSLMNENPSYIFFEERPALAEHEGPLGALGVPLTAMVSAAVDPARQPLGAPLWVEAAADGFSGRLMVAQDVGAAIKGPGRADLFIGAGPEAGRRAGRIKVGGRLVTLLPRGAARRIGA